uniref:uncharacterized protein LOC122604305 n=1 Tax=Erigeron canadensis TaxID=72917 RepID=UPI001CB997AC|nr:uncharacterized protein LOC122604305 [Erigeron canadensis]
MFELIYESRLFINDFDDEELMGVMSDCVELLKEGETSQRAVIPRTVITRDRVSANEQLMADYFIEDAKYPLWYFRRRFRMLRPLFMCTVNDIIAYPSRNSSHVPEHFRRMQDKILDGQQRLYKDEYLHKPTPKDIQRLEIIEDRAPDTSFMVNGTHYGKGYYLADDIYPEWSTFVKAYLCSQDDKKKKFKKCQESAIKDVERAFGCIQNQWHILSQPARAISINRICRTMYACVILHNMIVEDSGYAISSLEEDGMFQPPPVPRRTFQERMAVHQRTNNELHDRHVHHALRHDLTEHI